jgi:hypothetical protein
MKYYYIGFPKTGTQSIEKSLNNKVITNSHKIPYDIVFPNNNFFSFISIREPIKYYISMYKYKVSSKDKVKNYGIMDNNTFNDFIQDYVLCNNIEKWEKPWMNNYRQKLIKQYVQGKNLNIGYFTILYIFYCYKNPENILKQNDIIEYIKNNKPDINHIVRLEYLQEDYQNLIKEYNYPYVNNFCHINQSNQSSNKIIYDDYLYLKKYDNYIYNTYYNLK